MTVSLTKEREEYPMAPEQPINPDCREGKHEACTGDAWDRVRDTRTACTCDCHAAAPE